MKDLRNLESIFNSMGKTYSKPKSERTKVKNNPHKREKFNYQKYEKTEDKF